VSKKNKSEISAPVLKKAILDFVEKLRENENELQEIKERRKDIFEEYKDQLDVKAIKAALAIVKIRDAVLDQTALDNVLETLEARLGGYLDNEVVAEDEE
jgi:uncharacterized protein (UPF0335 family)